MLTDTIGKLVFLLTNQSIKSFGNKKSPALDGAFQIKFYNY